MLQAYNTIANGGVYVPPKLVNATVEADGTRHPNLPEGSEGRQVISRETANKMNLMLRSVVEEGTGTLAAITGYTPAGKTGTSRKPHPDGGYTWPDGAMHYQATFVGFVPAEAPELSIIVIIDEPTQEGIFGGVVAAPAFAKIGETALRHFAIPPPASDLAAAGLGGPGPDHRPRHRPRGHRRLDEPLVLGGPGAGAGRRLGATARHHRHHRAGRGRDRSAVHHADDRDGVHGREQLGCRRSDDRATSLRTREQLGRRVTTTGCWCGHVA